jgi:hypothetical protein
MDCPVSALARLLQYELTCDEAELQKKEVSFHSYGEKGSIIGL